MSYLIKTATTARPLLFLLISSTDHLSPLLGATPTVTLSKNGAAFGAPAGAVSELANGWYQVAANATDNNTVGILLLHATATGADPSDSQYEVVAFDPSSATNLGLSALPSAALNTAGGSRSALLANGTAQSGTSTTIVLAVGDTGTAAAYQGALLQITGGTGVGQTRTIAAYNAGTKTVTLVTGRTFGVVPDATSTYIIVADAHPALNDALQVVASSLASTDATATRVALALPAVGPGLAGGLAMIGETNQLLDSADLVAIANALLTAAISPTVRPTIGTVAEALAAARMAAIGNKSRTGNVVTGKASDDTTTFSTLTFDSITTPLTETRS